MAKYIFLTENGFGFKDSLPEFAHEGDKEISDDIYQQFFIRQNGGESLKIKDVNGITFDEIFESYQPESPKVTKPLEEEVAELKQLVADLAALQLEV